MVVVVFHWFTFHWCLKLSLSWCRTPLIFPAVHVAYAISQHVPTHPLDDTTGSLANYFSQHVSDHFS